MSKPKLSDYIPVAGELHVKLWDEINAVVTASGGKASNVSPARQHAVVRVEDTIALILAEREGAVLRELREKLLAMTGEFLGWERCVADKIRGQVEAVETDHNRMLDRLHAIWKLASDLPHSQPRETVDLETARRDYTFRLLESNVDRCRDCAHVSLRPNGSATCGLLNIEIANASKSRCPEWVASKPQEPPAPAAAPAPAPTAGVAEFERAVEDFQNNIENDLSEAVPMMSQATLSSRERLLAIMRTLLAERDAARKVVSACAGAVGASCGADCSDEFRAQVPAEVRAVVVRLTAERDAARKIIDDARVAMGCDSSVRLQFAVQATIGKIARAEAERDALKAEVTCFRSSIDDAAAAADCAPHDVAGRVRALKAEVERLRADQALHNDCIACGASLLSPDDDPPHCYDCHPTEDQSLEWSRKVTERLAALQPAPAAPAAETPKLSMIQMHYDDPGIVPAIVEAIDTLDSRVEALERERKGSGDG